MGQFQGKTVAFCTFGCKLNQTESAMLAAEFRARGWEIEKEERADLIVVNTCAVTARSESKVRQAIRHLARTNPRAAIAVVGCATQLHPDAYRTLPNVRWVLGVNSKFRLTEILGQVECITVDDEQREFVSPSAGFFWSRTRGFLKIQDGCRFRCSYCAVPLARGRSRSADPSLVLEQACALAERGHKEIVLTGVDIGSYGIDLRPRRSLAWLLRRLVDQLPQVRFRLSSVEPTEVTDELLETVSGLGQVCRHFHIPLQSGSDRILRQMHRPYTAGFYRQKIERLVSMMGELGLGSDVIVGFPGESEQDFSATTGLVHELPFTYLHVFPFSPRPGTAAARYPDDVPRRVKEARSELVRQMAAAKKEAFLAGQVGKTEIVLVEARREGGMLVGLTDKYVKVCFQGEDGLVNRFVRVKITRAAGGFLWGEPEDGSAPLALGKRAEASES